MFKKKYLQVDQMQYLKKSSSISIQFFLYSLYLFIRQIKNYEITLSLWLQKASFSIQK